MFVAVTLSIALILHLLICRRLVKPQQMHRYRHLVWAVLSLLFLLMVLNPLTWVIDFGFDLGRLIRGTAYTAMGIYSFIFTALVIRELAWGAARAGSLLPQDPSRRELLGHGVNVGMLGAAAIGAVAGYREARMRARVVKVPVPIPDLPEELSKFRIVQLSDVHVGPTIDRGYVQAIADEVDRLDADLIALTGDLVDGQVSKISSDVEPLGRMKSRYGTYCCTGNHEYYAGAEEWISELRRLGIRVLLNEHAIVEHGGRKILIGGVTDPQGTRFIDSHVPDTKACLAGSSTCDVKVLLAHRPASVYEASIAGFDLQLSGHTHGGQFFPWNLVARLVHEFPPGLAKHEKTWLYTSRGTGYFGPPFRLGAPSEITVLELIRA